ncbi:Checkpoint kinase 2 [Lobulomyces angularis]|nr:Checkpoint kinase 2 [Lobulomyces angularis]
MKKNDLIIEKTIWGRLLVLNENFQVVELTKEKYSIGRSRSNDIYCASPNSSKSHFSINFNGEFPFLVDTSANGTFVNNVKVYRKKVPLLNKSEIEIKHDFFFVFFNSVEEYNFGNYLINDRYYLFHSQTLGEGAHATVQLAIDIRDCKRLACKLIDKKKFKKVNSKDPALIDPTFISREENILLEEPRAFSRVIITDFGLSKRLGNSFERMRTKCGTLGYLAPEVFTDNQLKSGYTQKADCWSIGVLLFVMLTGQFPFGSDEDQRTLFMRIKKADFSFIQESIWSTVSDNAKDLIKKLLVVDPHIRLDVEESLHHPWICEQRELLDKLYFKMMKKCDWKES